MSMEYTELEPAVITQAYRHQLREVEHQHLQLAAVEATNQEVDKDEMKRLEDLAKELRNKINSVEGKGTEKSK